MKFEELAIPYFSDGDISQRILTLPRAGDVRQKVTETFSSIKDPYGECLVWLLGERQDMKGMLDALLGRETIMK